MNSFVARYHSITANRRYPNPWAIATKGELRHLQNSEQGVMPLENGLIAREKSCAFPFRFHIAHTIHQLAPCALPAIRREETVAETVEGALQGGSCTMMSPSSCRFSCRRFFFSPLCGAHICAAEFVSCKYGAKSCFEVTLYAYEGWLCTARLSDQSGVRAAIVFDLQHDMTDVELFMQYLLCLHADLVCTTHHHVIDVDMRFKVIVVFAHRPRVHVMDISHSGDPFDSSS